jgi:hypothetical protein
VILTPQSDDGAAGLSAGTEDIWLFVRTGLDNVSIVPFVISSFGFISVSVVSIALKPVSAKGLKSLSIALWSMLRRGWNQYQMH